MVVLDVTAADEDTIREVVAGLSAGVCGHGSANCCRFCDATRTPTRRPTCCASRRLSSRPHLIRHCSECECEAPELGSAPGLRFRFPQRRFNDRLLPWSPALQ
ncbi:hypothetical protein [Streptomyces flavidovirens]|uniref:hypothetical protein n=1 Tax=Streptomyces flavidovirens TaxID=67298 RepID=UPI003678ED0D